MFVRPPKGFVYVLEAVERSVGSVQDIEQWRISAADTLSAMIESHGLYAWKPGDQPVLIFQERGASAVWPDTVICNAENNIISFNVDHMARAIFAIGVDATETAVEKFTQFYSDAMALGRMFEGQFALIPISALKCETVGLGTTDKVRQALRTWRNEDIKAGRSVVRANLEKRGIYASSTVVGDVLREERGRRGIVVAQPGQNSDKSDI